MVPSCDLDAPEMSLFVHLYFTFPPYPRLTVDGHHVESFPPAPEVHRLYDAETVDRYVTALQQELAELQAQVDDARQLAHTAEQKMVEAEAAQALLGRMWLTAQADIDVKLAEAERQARYILADAQRQADAHIADTRMEAQAIINEAHETIEAVFTALTHRTEPGLTSAQQLVGAPTTGPSAPPASPPLLDLRTDAPGPAPVAGPWTWAAAGDDAGIEPVTASTGDVGAQIVDLSRIERRLHTLASRTTGPAAPQRGGDPVSQLTDERAAAEWSAYDPTGTDGGAVALTEAEREVSDDQAADDSLTGPPQVPLDEPFTRPAESHGAGADTSPAVGFERQWSPPGVNEGGLSGAPSDATNFTPAWGRPEASGEEAEPPPLTEAGEGTPWSGLPPTASWSPTSASFGPPTQWSSSLPDKAPTGTGGGAVVMPPVELPADSETFRPPPTLAGWRERWRLARDGESPLDDDVLSRADRLASLEDGTYVGELRDGPELPALDDERAVLELLPPPAGPPVILDETIGQAVEQARVRRPLKRARG